MLWNYAGEVQLQSSSSANWRITSLELSMFTASMKGYTNLEFLNPAPSSNSRGLGVCLALRKVRGLRVKEQYLYRYSNL